MIYFIHGPDRFLARQFAHERAIEADPGGENTSWFDAREASIESLLAAIGAVSLFGGARVVIVSDFLGRARRDPVSGDPDPAEDDRSGKADQGLLRLIEAVPQGNCLIMLDPALIAPPAALKRSTVPVDIIGAEPPRGAALVAWIVETAATVGSRIDRATAQFLAGTLYPQTWNRKANNPRFDRPPDLGRLSQEIDKLAAFAHPNPIAAHDLKLLVSSGPDQRMFRFLDAAMAGDLPAAITELDRLEAAGEEPAMLLAQLHGQIELAALAHAANNRDANTVSRDIGSITPSRISTAMAAARRAPRSTSNGVSLAGSVDRQLKTGRIRRPEDALYNLMLGLSNSELG